MKKAMVYIDGFNLYYGLRDIRPYVKWLNLQGLSESFIKDKETELSAVKYFTAYIKGDTDQRYRQKQYLTAIQLYSNKLVLIRGHFLLKNRKCKHCQHTTSIPEEKKTDVNIACHLLEDAYKNKFDVAYLVSGDSDLEAPVEMVSRHGKTVIIVCPPHRKSDALIHAANGCSFALNKKRLKLCQLPDRIEKSGEIVCCPEEWT